MIIHRALLSIYVLCFDDVDILSLGNSRQEHHDRQITRSIQNANQKELFFPGHSAVKHLGSKHFSVPDLSRFQLVSEAGK